MGEEVASRTVRADNYALSEHTKQFATRSRLVSPISPSRGASPAREAPPHPRYAGAHPPREGDDHARRARAASRRIAPESDSSARSGRPASSRFPSPTRPPPSSAVGWGPWVRAVHHARWRSRTSTRQWRLASDYSVRGSSSAVAWRIRGSRPPTCGLEVDAWSSSLRSAPTRPSGRFLAKRGPGMHHVAFEVADVASAVGKLAADGVEVIDAEPREGLGGHESRSSILIRYTAYSRR